MKRIILIIAVFLSIYLCSCSDTAENPLRFKIICLNSNFNGFYIVDGGTTTGIATTDMQNATWEVDIEVVVDDLLEITTVIPKPTDQNTTVTLEIKVYQNGVKLEERSVDYTYNSTKLSYDYQYKIKKDEKTTTTTTTTGTTQ
jgi:hypothetical protein